MAITFDFVGNDKGVVQTFEDIQASIQKTASTLEALGKFKGIDGLTEQIESLQDAIVANEKAIETSKEKLKQFAEKSKNALEIGDIQAFNDIQIDYSNELENLKDLIAGTNEYREALEQLTSAKGLASQTDTPLFFANEEDFKNIQEMREHIAELQAEIGNFNGSDEDLYELREALSDANDELRDAEEAASDAAQALGPKLGRQAAEASAKLYEINDAVEKQKKIVDDLTDQYNNAVEAVTALADSDDTAAREKALANYEMLAKQLHSAQNELTNLTNAQTEAQREWKKTSDEIDRHNSIITKLCGGEEKLNEIMDNLPGPLNKAVKGLEGMTGAAKAFIATPLGIILAGLILAWQTLSAWFERSEEGQLALAKTTGYLSGILDKLMDVVASVGEALYKMFTKPQEAGKSFLTFLKNQVMNRLKAVSQGAQALGKILAAAFSDHPIDNMKEGMTEFADAMAQFATGIEKPVTRAAKAMKDFHNSAVESANISVESKLLEREESKTKRLISEWENRERVLRAKRGKRTKEEEKELKGIEKKIIDAETKIIDKKIDLQKRSMDNSKYDSIEEKNKLDDLYSQRERIISRGNQRLTQIDMQGMSDRGKSAQKEAERLAKEQAARDAKTFQQRLAFAEEMAKTQKEANRSVEDAITESIADQGERERAAREIQHKRTIEDIKVKEDEIYKEIYKRRKEAYENANKDMKYENTDEGKLGWQALKVRTLEEVQNIEWEVISELGKSGIINAIEEQFGGGNVDLIARPLIDAAELVKAGWQDAGEGIATVFSMQEGIKDADGNTRQILFTPILPDGTVMTPDEMERYLHETLEGAKDILAADSKGLVISVGEVGFNGDLGGEALHELQEQLIDFPMEKLVEIQRLYGNIGGKNLTGKENELLKNKQKILKAELQKEEIIQARYEQERIAQQAQSMREYLSQYGTFQQKRLAMTEEYAEKIAKAEKSGNEWEVKKLSAERDTKIAQAKAQSLAMNIDWNQTFQGIGNVLQDIAKESLEKVKDYMETSEFKALGPEAKKAYQDLKNQLIDAGGQKASNPFSAKTWDEIGDLTEKYKDSVEDLVEYKEREEEAIDEYLKIYEKKRNAEKELADAVARQTYARLNGLDTTQADNDVKAAEENLANVTADLAKSFEEVTDASKQVTKQEQKVNTTQRELHDKTDAAAEGMKNFNTVVGQITSGSLVGLVDGLSNIIASFTKNAEDDMNGIIGMLGKKAGGIIGAILSIIDMLGDKPVEFFDNLLGGLERVIEEVIANIPEIIGSVIKGVGGIVGGIGKGIVRLFGLGGIFFGDNKPYEDALEKWQWVLDSWKDTIDYEKELMEKAYGVNAIKTLEQMRKTLERTDTAVKEIAKGWLDSGAGLFSHSNAYNVNEEIRWDYLSDEWMKQLGIIKKTLYGFRDQKLDFYEGGTVMKLFDLDWKELEALKNENAQFWGTLHSEVQNYIDEIIEAGKAAEEAEEQFFERITTTTKDNVFSDFLDSLYELADGSETVMDDIADNWQKMVNRMVVNNLIANDFQEKLEKWYEKLADVNKMRLDGVYSDNRYKEEIDRLKKEYDGYVTSAEDSIKQFTELGIIKPIEEAAEKTSGLFDDTASSWVSSLMDFNATAEEWAKDLGQMMAHKIIEEMVVPTLIQPLLDNLQKAFDAAMEENTFTESTGRKAFYWTKVLDNEGLKAAIEDINNAYPNLKETVQGILAMAGITMEEETEDFSNSLDNVRDTLVDGLLTLEEDADDIGKKVGSTLIREMIEQMLASGVYADRMEAIRQMWQDILTGKDVTHTREDVISELRQLQDDMARDENMGSLVSEWKDLNKELEKTKEGFSDLRSTIVSSLTSAENTIEDFSKSLGKSMMSQMLDAYIDSNYKEEITALSEEWGEALASGNTKALEEIQKKVISLYKSIGEEDIEVKNLADAIREIDRVLDTTFQDMTDSWVSALSNMEGTAEEFAENVGKTMAQKIISEMIAPIYIQPLLNSMQEAYNEAVDVQGATISSVMNTLSPYLEQVKIVYTEIQPMVESIFGGFGIYKKAAEEATDEVEYRLGDLKSNFSSALMDMENSAADFSKDISKVLAQNFIENFVLGDRFDQQMEYWKQQYESIIGSGMSESERKRQLKALRDSIATAKEGYVNSALAIQELLGLTTEDKQEATMNMADKITYDQADQLLGINLAQELTLEQILATLQGKPVQSTYTGYSNDEVSRQVAATLQGMKDVSKVGNDNMLIQLATANSHLQLIRDYSKNIRDEVMLHLGSMDSKLSCLRTL